MQRLPQKQGPFDVQSTVFGVLRKHLTFSDPGPFPFPSLHFLRHFGCKELPANRIISISTANDQQHTVSVLITY